jgi:hypothetical protein
LKHALVNLIDDSFHPREQILSLFRILGFVES